MGYQEIEIRIPVGHSSDELNKQIKRKIHLTDFIIYIQRKSLDARNKKQICWQYRIGIESDQIKSGDKPTFEQIKIPNKNYKDKAVVVGSGPAGIFCALTLIKAGVKVTLIERGSDVVKRKNSIDHFDKTGIFDPNNNYCFGEGGAGTFSDGKLTSRTKGISLERNFIYKTFIEAGAPEEINYMTHPHLGSDKLFTITQNLRQQFINLGGEMLFETCLKNFSLKNDYIIKIETNKGNIDANHFVLATGHSSLETTRMLIKNNVPFQTKNFAIGMRAEHHQEIINKAQWGKTSLPGVKAAEYRLTANLPDKKPFYSFCMCPGGIVVPATAYSHTNIVNGMSLYNRDGLFANAAVVTGVHPNSILKKEASPLEALEWLENLESHFFDYSHSYKAPSVTIKDFLNNKVSGNLPKSSYVHDLICADLFDLLPPEILNAMKSGLQQFNKKLFGYDQGILLGLESKTSSPVQVIRDKQTFRCGYENLYIAGEGSGWTGGIISSAADGVRVAMALLKTAK